MSSLPSWHLQQYQHNVEFAQGIDREAYRDWAIVATFYAALHLVQDIFMDEFGSVPDNHYDRAKWLGKSARTKPIAADYDALKSLAEKVRYRTEYRQVADQLVQNADSLLCAIEAALSSGRPQGTE